jgi:superfamily II DNA or RNA helicase
MISPQSVQTAQSFSLRDYQHGLVQQVFAEWHRGNRRVCLQLPTGGGKTPIAAAIARQFTEKSEPLLFLAHKEELILQAQSKLEAICGVEAGIIKAGYPVRPDALIQVASVQTLARRQLHFEPALVVTDECHHSAADTYTSIYAQAPNSYHLGVTATSIRLDGKGLSGVYDVLIQGVSVRSLIEQGHLSRYRLFAAAAQVDTKGIKTTAGDYNVAQLRRAATTAAVMGAIVPTWQQYANGKQSVVFCIDIEHSQNVCSLFLQAGVTAAHLDGNTPYSERREILRQFEAGNITVLCNCGIVSEGLDIPGIEAVQILRPTQSVALYLQQIGRALRPAEGKDCAIIIDHTRNWIEHGLPDDDRDWSLDGQVKRTGKAVERSEDGEVVEREAPSFDPTVPMAEVIAEPVNPRFIHLLDELIAQQQMRGYRSGWVAYRFLDLKPGLPELKECARRLGYSPGWAWHKHQELQANGGVAA